MKDEENVCCPKLEVVGCADTDKHKHLVCTRSGDAVSNKRIKDYCVGNHNNCILNREDNLYCPHLNKPLMVCLISKSALKIEMARKYCLSEFNNCIHFSSQSGEKS